jgi:hypothetical protein
MLANPIVNGYRLLAFKDMKNYTNSFKYSQLSDIFNEELTLFYNGSVIKQ